uniref:Putative secreted protein n=1 Tax=Anopheles marajoara TaxID=58244 RepID=A0A2M4C921_9DIPT
MQFSFSQLMVLFAMAGSDPVMARQELHRCSYTVGTMVGARQWASLDAKWYILRLSKRAISPIGSSEVTTLNPSLLWESCSAQWVLISCSSRSFISTI